MSTISRAAVEALYRLPEDRKAELVNGEIIEMAPTGFLPSYAAGEIFASLRAYSRRTGRGIAVTDNAGFLVDLPSRSSFSPDAAYYTGRRTGMRFFEGAPVFAVEVRSLGDYGPQAEQTLAQKRADYFAAGTWVVWDVDLQSELVVRVYRADRPNQPAIYRRGDIAEAEPAVPGWTLTVDDLFPHE
jgi:Uma2 family endonuclease